MTTDLGKILEFLHQTEKLKTTLRHSWTTTGRQESTAEHTWRVLLIFILLQRHCQFPIDEKKVLQMIIVHDLPEVIYGDVPGFKKVANDKEKEWHAAQTLFSSLPKHQASALLSLVTEYNAAKTQEALVAKVCDRLETLLSHLEAGIEHMTEEEIGDHTSTYGKEYMERLNHPFVNALYKQIKEKLEIMMGTSTAA